MAMGLAMGCFRIHTGNARHGRPDLTHLTPSAAYVEGKTTFEPSLPSFDGARCRTCSWIPAITSDHIPSQQRRMTAAARVPWVIRVVGVI